ncbi:MAG TPA: GNAT family N-acetyltransferase [Micromonosporaceae bacterium]
MLTRRDDGYEIDSTTSRIDQAKVFEWLSTDAYWAYGRPAEMVARSIRNSLCYGVYDPGGKQVGFARVVTDEATFAWLCDVYIGPDHRGKGLGTWLAQTVHDDVTARGVPRIMLATADAHEVYAKVGFVPLADPGRWMELDRRPQHPRPPRRTPDPTGNGSTTADQPGDVSHS